MRSGDGRRRGRVRRGGLLREGTGGRGGAVAGGEWVCGPMQAVAGGLCFIIFLLKAVCFLCWVRWRAPT